MKIALCHFRVGETDGVSLEMDKWKLVLERLGHEVIYIAGSPGTLPFEKVKIIEEMHYLNSENNEIVENVYLRKGNLSEEVIREKIEKIALAVEEKLTKIVQVEQIDMIVPNNIFSLGWNLPVALGFKRAIEKHEIKTICHHHDFYWEREKYSNPKFEFVKKMLENNFPLDYKWVKHCVINSLGQKELFKRKGIDSTVVPNVFDFTVEPWKKDNYNFDLRDVIGVKENDLIFLQATRIVERKGIEIALDFMAKILERREKLYGKTLYNDKNFTDESEIYFVMAGLNEGEGDYLGKLLEKGQELGIKIKHINSIIDHSRHEKNGKKIYSLWDAYIFADMVTYPSLLEGWGNQYLEALFAQKPVAIYRYPVYNADLQRHGFNNIDLGDEHTMNSKGLAFIKEEILNKAAEETIEILTNKERYMELVRENYDIADKNFSYEALKKILGEIF